MEIFDKVNYIKIEPALIAIHINKVYKICIHTDYTRDSDTDHCTCSSDSHTQPEAGECGHEAPISNQSVNDPTRHLDTTCYGQHEGHHRLAHSYRAYKNNKK